MKRTPSQEKPWLKYYSKEALEHTVPQLTAYGFMKEINQKNQDNTAINYYGSAISYGSCSPVLMRPPTPLPPTASKKATWCASSPLASPKPSAPSTP